MKQCLRFDPENAECQAEFDAANKFSEVRKLALDVFKTNQWLQSIVPLKKAIGKYLKCSLRITLTSAKQMPPSP